MKINKKEAKKKEDLLNTSYARTLLVLLVCLIASSLLSGVEGLEQKWTPSHTYAKSALLTVFKWNLIVCFKFFHPCHMAFQKHFLWAASGKCCTHHGRHGSHKVLVIFSNTDISLNNTRHAITWRTYYILCSFATRVVFLVRVSNQPIKSQK